jgi:hypothetical protein
LLQWSILQSLTEYSGHMNVVDINELAAALHPLRRLAAVPSPL